MSEDVEKIESKRERAIRILWLVIILLSVAVSSLVFSYISSTKEVTNLPAEIRQEVSHFVAERSISASSYRCYESGFLKHEIRCYVWYYKDLNGDGVTSLDTEIAFYGMYYLWNNYLTYHIFATTFLEDFRGEVATMKTNCEVCEFEFEKIKI